MYRVNMAASCQVALKGAYRSARSSYTEKEADATLRWTTCLYNTSYGFAGCLHGCLPGHCSAALAILVMFLKHSQA